MELAGCQFVFHRRLGSGPIRPVNQVNNVESTDKIGEVPRPGRPKSPRTRTTATWTGRSAWTKGRGTEGGGGRAEEEPISKMLIEHIQSLWRASAMAVEASLEAQQKEQGQEVHQKVQPARAASERLTYEDVTVKRTNGL
jgi:hypothetical protein